jgi:SAM-dependent methyltransferase
MTFAPSAFCLRRNAVGLTFRLYRFTVARMDSSAYRILARTYDLQHYLFTPDVPMYERLARQLAPGQPLLEIGCGTGRVLLPLAQAGFEIVGVDNSPEMLAIGWTRLHGAAISPGARLKAEMIEADALSFDLGRQFGLAFIALNTFLHNLSRESQLQTLRNAHRHLLPGGSLVIDLPPNDELASQPDDGEFIFDAALIDPATQTRIDKYVASEVFWATQEQALRYKMVENGVDGVVEEIAAFKLRHVFKHEMELLFVQSGFAPPIWYGDYDLSPYEDASPRMIAVAQA